MALIHKKKTIQRFFKRQLLGFSFWKRKGMASLTIEEENIGKQGETRNKQPHDNWSDEYQTPQGRHNEDSESRDYLTELKTKITLLALEPMNIGPHHKSY